MTKGRCDLWSRIWCTSRILAELLLSRAVHMHLESAAVIELGAGTALCGLCAALKGAKVVVTDSSAMALELALENAALNGLEGGQLRTCKLDWYYAGMARVNAPASG